MWYNQDQDKRLVSRLRLGQDERGLARLGLVSFETVLAWLIEKPDPNIPDPSNHPERNWNRRDAFCSEGYL
jgi:hypothetical protein